MKFCLAASLLYLAGGVYGAVATPPPTRLGGFTPIPLEHDLPTAISVLTAVNTSFNVVEAAVREYHGDIAPLRAAASDFLSTIQSGTTTVNGMTPLTAAECLSLISPARDLQDRSRALAIQLKEKKTIIQRHKHCATIHDFLDKGTPLSVGLITAVVSKVPKNFRGIVQREGDKITKEIEDSRETFAPVNCSDA
ncbi:cell wall protein [Pochonia chlamydosporia 170]|uniref:Cell wall protein n=1 Tax=Pochonia chlamydosporia 170 TaxID=1380566 RepID=A0A179FWR8_METCM|nr:cell wall protein [Pochonia chlamydosporia 170]OAQ69640.1 cell wall protein [Pochonia chlamydosporia 170]